MKSPWTILGLHLAPFVAVYAYVWLGAETQLFYPSMELWWLALLALAAGLLPIALARESRWKYELAVGYVLFYGIALFWWLFFAYVQVTGDGP